MAESFLVSTITSITAKISTMISGETMWPDELSKLKKTMATIRASHLDSKNKLGNNRYLRDWLENLKEAIYDVDGVLDKFQDEVGAVKIRFFHLPNPVTWLKLHHKIRKTRERLEDVLDDGSEYNTIVEGDDQDSNVMDTVYEPRPVMSQSYIIRRETDKQEIIDFLLEEKQINNSAYKNVSIMSIVGIGGLGKTTLAKMVYDDKEVNKHFSLKRWMCVSEDFDIIKLRKGVINPTSNGSLSPISKDNFESGSHGILENEKFLLVLDYLSYEDWRIWEELKKMVSKGSEGSKILITTRSMLVTSTPSSVHTYKLPSLSEVESLDLFNKLAFDEGVEIENKDMLIKEGKEIVKKCSGLPLALCFLGSVLHMNPNIQEWESISNNEMWNSYQDSPSILPALKLSYERLPSYLKHCFAILSLYPKNSEFRGIDLVQLWMAQGLIIPIKDDDDLVVIGESYVMELWSRSFIQQVNDNYDIYSKFKMHDLVHDLALITSQNECWSVNFRTQNVPKTVLHVSFYDADLSKGAKSLLDLNVNLRSIMFPVKGVGPANNSFVETWITRFKYLRVLDLSDTCFEPLPEFIGKLNYLRLLSLSNNRCIKKLPKSMCKLQSLQSLRLNGCTELEKLPKDIGNLTNLMFLYITTKQERLDISSLISLRFLSISHCTSLNSIEEKDVTRLTALHAMSINDCKKLNGLPSGLRKLAILKIKDCPELSIACQPSKGKDWLKIDHIPDITIDGQKIKDRS